MVYVPEPIITKKETDDPNCRVYGITTQISEAGRCITLLPPLNPKGYIDGHNEIGDAGMTLVRSLNEILGIVVITLERYSVKICVGDAFDLDGVEGDIIPRLKACYEDDPEEIDVFKLEELRAQRAKEKEDNAANNNTHDE